MYYHECKPTVLSGVSTNPAQFREVVSHIDWPLQQYTFWLVSTHIDGNTCTCIQIIPPSSWDSQKWCILLYWVAKLKKQPTLEEGTPDSPPPVFTHTPVSRIITSYSAATQNLFISWETWDLGSSTYFIYFGKWVFKAALTILSTVLSWYVRPAQVFSQQPLL